MEIKMREVSALGHEIIYRKLFYSQEQMVQKPQHDLKTNFFIIDFIFLSFKTPAKSSTWREIVYVEATKVEPTLREHVSHSYFTLRAIKDCSSYFTGNVLVDLT